MAKARWRVDMGIVAMVVMGLLGIDKVYGKEPNEGMKTGRVRIERIEPKNKVPFRLSYQGYLTDSSGKPIDGFVKMEFKIYDDSIGGNELWSSNKGRNIQEVRVKRGIFHVILSGIDASVFRSGDRRWLEVIVNKEVLRPRVEITSVGYAYNAYTVGGHEYGEFVMKGDSAGGDLGGAYPNPRIERIKGKPISDIEPNIGDVLKWDGEAWVPESDSSEDADWVIQGGNMYAGIGGNVGIGTKEPEGKLHVSGGDLRLDDNNIVFKSDDPGDIVFEDARGSEKARIYADPTPRVNKLHFRTGGIDRMVIDDSGNVGIGTTRPKNKLDVNGGLAVGSYAGANAAPSGGAIISGNVGIGTTNPGSKLDVAGTIRARDIFGSGGKNLIIGDDAYLTDVDQANILGIYGMQNSDRAGIRLGSDGSLIFGDNGNVGIGTTAPKGKLDVVAGWGDWLSLSRTAGSGFWHIHNPSSQERIEIGYTDDGGSTKWGMFVIKNTGNIGIGTTSPGNILTIAQGKGHAIADGWDTYSSIRWKTNIKPITHALDKVMKLRGVYFDWKKTGKHDIGMIAEEVGKVIPEVVEYEKDGKYAKSLDYARLTAVLVEAIKEQQKEIEELRDRIKKLEEKQKE